MRGTAGAAIAAVAFIGLIGAMTPKPADLRRVGETADFDWMPEPGEYILTADFFGPKPFMTRKLIVR